MTDVETTGPSTLPLLGSQFRLGHMELRNRVAMAPHSTHYADQVETERLTDYYVERARAEVGLIIHEPVIVHPSSLSRVGKIWGYDERNIEAYRRTTDAVHEQGSRIVCQLIHNGRQVDGHESQMPAWYPGEVARGGTIESTHAMTPPEIAEVVEGFARAAEICARGGFDGVEVHAAHGYLLQAFLSPATNSRDDEYGGSLQGRVRIVREILEAIRRRVARPFVVGVRLAGDEGHEGGLDERAAVDIARELADEVDYISVVSGSLATYDRIVPDMSFPRGLNVPYASAIRAVVAPTPVLVTGRIADPQQAEAILARGDADLIGLARSLIADPQWVRKGLSGQSDTIRPCVYANDCRDSIGGRRSLVCMVNPAAGREGVKPAAPAESRRVVVVGGGVAGLEAALTAAARGDRVTLFERSAELGGQVRDAAAVESRAELRRLLVYLAREIERSEVELRLNAEPDEAALRALAPDLVIVATGAKAMRPADDAGPTALDVIGGLEITASTVVLHDRSGGNSWPLLLAAELLAERGHQVVLVVPAHAFATGIEAASVPPLLRRLRERQVRIEMLSTVLDSDASGVRIQRRDTGTVTTFPGAVAVGEFGRRSAGSAGPWDRLGTEVRVIGDALAPRRIGTALREGREAGLSS